MADAAAFLGAIMPHRILVLGASYGSLFATKLAMAGHDATLVCRSATAALIAAEGTEVRLTLRGEDAPRSLRSTRLPGRIDAAVPEAVDPAGYDLAVLAMQEPQYCAHTLRLLLGRIAEARLPCLSIMNMPPLPFLRRLPGLDTAPLEAAYADPRLWDRFEPGLVSLCSPDPQAVRPPGEAANVLRVGLPTNFKAAAFADPAHTALLRGLERDIDALRLDGHPVPVKLRVSDSLYVPLAKWAMLLTGNYRCILPGGARAIRAAVHEDEALSREVYDHVAALARRMGAEAASQVPFDRYAAAAQALANPSSVARAVAGGAPQIERVDRLVQLVARQYGMAHPEIDAIVQTVDTALRANSSAVA